jgi:cell division protein FtsN
MRKLTFLIIIGISLVSCGGQKKIQKSAAELNATPVQAEETPEAEPVKEVEEKLVEIEEEPIEKYDFYVIIGSFRNKDNAIDYQEDITGKGFSPFLLRNEEGLYRVAVNSFNDIMLARSEVRRIRSEFPEHADTWLLIRMK